MSPLWFSAPTVDGTRNVRAWVRGESHRGALVFSHYRTPRSQQIDAPFAAHFGGVTQSVPTPASMTLASDQLDAHAEAPAHRTDENLFARDGDPFEVERQKELARGQCLGWVKPKLRTAFDELCAT